MKKIGIIFMTIGFTCILMLSGCSKQDPMDMPMKATTLKEYGDSMIKISKAIKDPNDQKKFLESLELVAIGPKAMIAKDLPPSLGGYDKNKMEELAKKYHGKTPREIIKIAEKWKEDPSRDAKAFLKEMLEPETPENKQARESDAAWRVWSGTILNGLNKLDGSKERWIERNKLGTNAIPTKEDIIKAFGEQAWPQSNFPSGAEYIFTPDGKPACIIDGKTITRDNILLYKKGVVQ